jgi:uncharacterized protein with beta-barrel porin domain
MRPFLPIAILVAPFLSQTAQAQIVNGSFETGDFTGWQIVGTPTITTATGPTPPPLNPPPTPPAGTFQALINSTGSGAPAGTAYSAVNAVPAATLNTFLGTTLPSTISNSVPGFPPGTVIPPINGEAIKQTFSSPGGGKITFDYEYGSREAPGNGADGTGYTINGVYTNLANSLTPGQGGVGVGFFTFGLPYQSTTVTVGPGQTTFGLVAYNTGNAASPSGLFLDDFVFVPFFGTVPGLTPNQQAVGNNIDTINNGAVPPNLAAIIAALGMAADPAALGAELDQLSPQTLQVFRNIAFDGATFTTLDVNNHLANLRDGLTGFDPSQVNVSDPGLSSDSSRIKNHFRDPKQMYDPKDMKDTKEMAPAYAPEPDRWSTFIAGDVTLADLSHDQDLAHQDYTTGSVMLGADYRLDDHWTIGALFDYSHTDVDLDDIGSTGTVDTYSPGIYASYVDGGWYGNALFTYGFNSYTEDRNISLPGLSGTNRGAPDGNQYTGSLTGGYEFRTGDFKYGPYAGLQYVNLDINSFSEDGPTALNVQDESDDSLRSQLGFQARYITHVGSFYLTPHVSAGWQHEFLNNSDGITSQFAGSGANPFTVQTTPEDRDSAVISAGLDADVASNVTLFTDYQTEVGDSHYFAQSILAGVCVHF